MKVILIQNVSSLGKAGEIKNVADGYASNFLLPKKLAVMANEDNIKKQEALCAENKLKEDKFIEELKKTAREIEGMEIVIEAKAKDGKLFGSIGAREIKKALAKKNISVETGQLIIPEPIKEVGDKKVTIRLNREIEAKIVLKVLGI